MKKIILALIFTITASFPAWTNYTAVSTGDVIYYLSRYCQIGTPTIQGPSYVTYATGNNNLCGVWQISDAYQVSYHQCTDTGTNYKVMTYIYPMTFVSSCPSGQDLNTSGVCSAPLIPPCPTGSKYDTTLKTCVSNYEVLSKNTFDNGNFIVSWVDGASTYCDVSESKCITHDKNWNVIPNRFINPEFNMDGTIKYTGSLPDVLPTSTWSGATYDAFGKPLVNVAGKFLQALGMGIALTSTGGGYLVFDSPGLNAVNPFAVVGSGLFTLGNAMVTPDDVTTAVPNGSDSVQVKVSNNTGTSFTPLDAVASSAPSDGTPVFSPNGVYTYRQITDANLKTVWDTAAGVGTLPPTALVRGSDIIYPTNNPNTALINSPTQIEIVKTSPDNSAQSVVINKADLANTANSGTDLPYTVKDYAPPVINNDGTKTQPVTSTPSSMSPSTGTGTSTNPTTGQTTTANPSTGTNNAGMSNGTNIDLSGVTGRLDGLANQLTKLNGSADTGNGLLGDIKVNIGSIASNTASAKGSLASIDGTLNSIKNDLERTDIASTSHNIPKDTSGGDWNTWKSTWDNIKGSFDSVKDQTDSFKSLFQNGFSLDLTGGTVIQCPYSKTVDFGFFTFPLSIDLCAFLSPFRSVFYALFYLIFTRDILIFSFKMFMRMV